MSCPEHNASGIYPTEAGKSLTSVSATDPSTTAETLQTIIERDGAVIVKNLISPELAAQIKSEIKPIFDADVPDKAGFFPSSTKRGSKILAKSDSAPELVTNKLFQQTAERMLNSDYTYWQGQEQLRVVGKPHIDSIVGFRVEPGGKQQCLHRDDADHHTRNCDMPVMLGCVTALTRTTKENGATIVIPKSHKWGPDRCPYNEEAIPGELEVGDAMFFVGNVYHAGGSNTTKNEARETIGVFMCKGNLRQEENPYLELPPELCKERGFSPELLRLLGYGIFPPALGLYNYNDPMEECFGIVDKDTISR